MKEKEKSGDAEESISLRGLVVDWNLPSKAILVDWLKQTVEEVRVKEVVELFPKEIFDELETIRRTFYYNLEKLTIPAYSLKLLPVEALPKFQGVIKTTRARLQKLDHDIQAALESEYTKKATKYYTQHADRRARLVESISHRFQVFMMPLRLDRILWDEFLSESMQKELERIRERYERERTSLEAQLESIREQIESAVKELEARRKDLADAEAEVEKVYEGVKIPYDIALLRVQKSELQGKVKDLKARARELQMKIQRLEREQREREAGFGRATVWARRQTEETQRRIRFDTRRVWEQEIEDFVREALDSLEETPKVRDRILRKLERAAKASLDRIYSVMPTSRLVKAYEKFITAVKEALEGKIELAKEKLEGLS
ncbi:MAG: hypothetical protein ACE5Z5_11015 [Candidatus Bathyarchaeia archaeon]